MAQQLYAWMAQRNSDCSSVSWHFTSSDARIKLKSLYPKI